MSFLEGGVARGDRRLSKAIKAAFEAGCRFDSWGDQFRFDIWQKAFKDTGVDPEFYTYRRRDRNEIFPWDHLNSRVDKEFLYKEYEKSVNTENTPDCKVEKCSVCGICDHKAVKNISFYEKQAMGYRQEAIKKTSDYNLLPIANRPLPSFKIRLTFSKTGEMKYLGHLELVTLFSRAIRRAEIPVAYSAGFHPLPKFTFGSPLSVGIESMAEEMDLELAEYMKPYEIYERLNKTLPDGIKILEAAEVPLKLNHISAIITETTYLIFLENGRSLTSISRSKMEERINMLLQRDEIIIHQQRQGEKRSINMRPLIKKFFLADDNTLQLTLGKGESGNVKPHEVAAHFLGIPDNESKLFSIMKIKGESKAL